MTELADVAKDHLQVLERVPGEHGEELESGSSRVGALALRLVGGVMPEAGSLRDFEKAVTEEMGH